MSTLKADTIQSTGGGAATLTKQSAAKARIHSNQTTVNDSFNMTATTDHGTGDYTFSITNSFTDQYWQLAHEAGTEGTTYGLYLRKSSTAKTSSAHRFLTTSNGAVNQDAVEIQQVCFGDLA